MLLNKTSDLPSAHIQQVRTERAPFRVRALACSLLGCLIWLLVGQGSSSPAIRTAISLLPQSPDLDALVDQRKLLGELAGEVWSRYLSDVMRRSKVAKSKDPPSDCATTQARVAKPFGVDTPNRPFFTLSGTLPTRAIHSGLLEYLRFGSSTKAGSELSSEDDGDETAAMERRDGRESQ